MLEYLLPDPWFGTVKSSEEIAAIKDRLPHIETERERLFSLLELFKAGDFTTKNLLIDLMNTTKDESVQNACIILFAQIATHDDIRNSQNLRFLATVGYDNALAFGSFAIDMLSYEIVPYLLAMLEEWDIGGDEDSFRLALQIITGYDKTLDEDAPAEEIGQFFLEEVKYEADLYYYKQKPVFPGDFAKELGMRTAIAAQTGSRLNTYRPTVFLSTWSGIECPVESNSHIDEKSLRDVYAYIDKISALEWKEGHKYFYHHELQ